MTFKEHNSTLEHCVCGVLQTSSRCCAEQEMSILPFQWIQLTVSRGAVNIWVLTIIAVMFYCNACPWLFQWFDIITSESCMCNPYAWLACRQSCSISQLPYVMFGILSPLNLLNVCVVVALKKIKKNSKSAWCNQSACARARGRSLSAGGTWKAPVSVETLNEQIGCNRINVFPYAVNWFQSPCRGQTVP